MNKKLIYVITSALMMTACSQTTTPAPTEVKTPKSAFMLSVVQAIPKPTDMRADVITHGRTATIKHLDIASIGKQLPFTFSHGKVENTESFEWFVSKHFALKTDYPAQRAKFFLELLELSYPYYVEFYGMEPPNIANQRIASTYATNVEKLRLSMFDDGFNRGVHHYAGGEAMFYNQVGYSFPTERPQHQRYIAIHETMHSFQMAVGNYPWTPSWHGEGLGDSLANHIFDPDKKQLTVFGHDVPIFDVVTQGVFMFEKEKPTLEAIHNRKKFNRGLNVLFVQFMYNQPEYTQYMKIYHQEVIKRQTASRKESLAILKDIVPDWQALEAEFKHWAENIDKTHEVASRGQWEVFGNKFYKRKTSSNYGPQRLGFNVLPMDSPGYSPFKLDYPLPTESSLILPAKRGVEEPTISYLIDFEREQLNQGSIGMSFGVQSTVKNAKEKAESYTLWKGANTDLDQQYRIEIEQGSLLTLDASMLGGALKKVELPQAMQMSLARQTKPKLGVSVQFKKLALEVTVKAENTPDFVTSIPLTVAQFNQLTKRPFGLVSTDNQHSITPYFDDGRNLNPVKPDYTVNTAPNAWGFKGDALSLRLARGIWKTKETTPVSWKKAFERINQATLEPSIAATEIKAIEKLMPVLAHDGKGMNDALAELSGVDLKVDWLGTSASTLKEYAIIKNTGTGLITANLIFSVGESKTLSQEVTLNPDKRIDIEIPTDLLSKGEFVTATLSYEWENQLITKSLTQKTKKHNGFELINMTAAHKDGALTVSAKVLGPFSGETKGNITFDLYYGHNSERIKQVVALQPYEEKIYQHIFNIEGDKLVHDAWFEITVIADVDGEPVTLRKRLPFVPDRKKR
jgi:hypothetical protein